jgi:hypothetical protein
LIALSWSDVREEKETAEAAGVRSQRHGIIDVEHSHDSAAKAVALVREGRAKS